MGVNFCVVAQFIARSPFDFALSTKLEGFAQGTRDSKLITFVSTETREMAIKGERKSPTNILEEMMHISIVRGTTVIWSSSVESFYNQDKIGMGTFDPGADLDYDFTVSMSSDADDNYQNRETVFDLTLGFWGDPILPGTVAGAATGPDGLLGLATGADLIYSVLGSLAALSTGLYLRRRSSSDLAIK